MTEPIIYYFEIVGLRREALGPVPLSDDDDAVEFAKQTIRDLNSEGDDYAGCSMLITAATRVVAIVPVMVPN